MKVFGIEVTDQVREDAVFVIAIALLIVGVGTVIEKAFDRASPLIHLERIEQRLTALEKVIEEKINE